METLIIVKDNAKQTQPTPLVNAEDDANNTSLEQTLVGANDDPNKKLVLTIASRNASIISGTVVENGEYRNLHKKFDSPYLLRHVIRKVKTKGTGLKFDKIYFDHLCNNRRWKLLETGLTTFYETTLPLLEESNLLSDQCKILLPFNKITMHHLHKAWNKTKKKFTVKFLTDTDSNLWYKAC